MRLHHVLTQQAWEAARETGIHAPPELERDGFLHCCTPAQLGFVLTRHFHDAPGVLILTFDAKATGAEIDWTKSEPDQPPFPHLRGPIPLASVTAVAPRPR